jgi:hypothetical protein
MIQHYWSEIQFHCFGSVKIPPKSDIYIILFLDNILLSVFLRCDFTLIVMGGILNFAK